MTDTLIIGLDAATWDVIRPLRDQGVLSNINELIQEGTSGTLRSTIPPMTPLAWTSLATGVNPGKHGVYDFLEQDIDTYRIRPTHYGRMSRPAVWDIFDAKEKDIGVINYPLVRPPVETGSFFVSGIPASIGERIAFPDSVQAYLESVGYRVTPDALPEDGATPYFQDIQDLTKTQADVTIEMLKRYDPDLCWTVFMGIDWIQHYLWGQTINGQDAVESFYVFMDEILGRLLDAVLEETTVIVISDHGARRIEGEIHLNSLLEERGYLARKEMDRSTIAAVKRGITGMLWRFGNRFPAKIKPSIKLVISEKTVYEGRAAAGFGQFGLHDSIRWDETVAFSYGYMGRLFINTVDKYPDGTVSSDMYDDVVDELINRFESLTHPVTDEHLIERAVRGTDVYSGAAIQSAPDVLLIPRDWRYMFYGDFDDEWIHDPRGRIADHDPCGIFAISGPQIQTGIQIDPDITDFAPTLLALSGLPILDDMDGEVLEDIFTKEFCSAYEHIVVSSDEFELTPSEVAASDNASVLDRLEDLGYL